MTDVLRTTEFTRLNPSCKKLVKWKMKSPKMNVLIEVCVEKSMLDEAELQISHELGGWDLEKDLDENQK